MDDVDAVQAQIARNMVDSGDWVTARLNGIAYLEKAPLKYWMIGASYLVFGVHDWAARIPMVLATIALCWLTFHMGAWAFSKEAGFYAGLALATSIGLFLFTRILIPDVVLTLAIALALWGFLRALEEGGWKWPLIAWGAIGTGFLLKGLIAMLFPLASAGIYLLLTRQLLSGEVWKRLRPVAGASLVALMTAPWLVLATLRNPPYFDFTMRSAPGEYHGFFWFFFFNEHLFRFLNMRHPRDYNTVPRLYFWLFHLLWLFPWSAYLPAALRPASWKGTLAASGRAGQMRLLALCWTGFLLAFFTFSTTQEYYSMPCYPALALLIGSTIAAPEEWNRRWLTAGTRTLALIATLAASALLALLWMVRGEAAPGDISNALTSNPDAYTLSLGHVLDLTVASFAYLRAPMVVALCAFVVGAAACWLWRTQRAALGLAMMMVLFTHAARMALVAFDPYLASRPLAEALRKAPAGEIIFDNQYYTFSSVFFYANVKGWLLNGRVNNLEYGSYAPGAENVFLDDDEFVRRWRSPARYYLVIEGPSLKRLEKRLGPDALHPVAASGGKYIFTNRAS
ncbi:MAG: glycosyltransferase family 39 protein [Acidobacteriia bacterium]|nr:glycosyltransferase family 39 protein [Terriglobia bacterium]